MTKVLKMAPTDARMIAFTAEVYWSCLDLWAVLGRLR